MLDWTSRFGRHVNRRLEQEQIIWLTTVDSKNTPQPRPVWFHWDGQTVLIFSEPNTGKLRHITRNPRVSLNFNTDADGDEVAVLLGNAEIAYEPPPLEHPARPGVSAVLRRARGAVPPGAIRIHGGGASHPPPDRMKKYLRKYRQGIKDLGMTVQEFTEAYSVPILVTPEAMRGL